MEKLELRVDRLEEDVKELKRYRDECFENNNKTKTDLAIAVQKMEDLIKTVEELPLNLEKTMANSIQLQAKEHEKMYSEIADLRKDNEAVNKRVEELKRLIDERTIEEDSRAFNQVKYTIAITIITGIISFVLGLILK